MPNGTGRDGTRPMFTFVVWAIGLWIMWRIGVFLWLAVSGFFESIGEERRERAHNKRWAENMERYRQLHANDMAFCCECGAGNHPSVPFCYQCGKWMGGRRPHEAPVDLPACPQQPATGETHEATAKAAAVAHSWNRTAIRAEFGELAASDRKDRI